MTTTPDTPDTTKFDWTPEQWRDIGERLLNLAIDASTNWSDRSPAPSSNSIPTDAYRSPIPNDPATLDDLTASLEQLASDSVYNGHPRFFAYITSSPAPIGVLGDLVASALNQNTGLHRIAPAATAIELQTIDWIKEMVGYPSDAEGVFVSGGQMANVVAYTTFRENKTPWDTRRYGLRGLDGAAPQLRVYTSTESHYCHEQAAELLGMGRDAIRPVPVDDDYRMRIDALVAIIAEDRARGDLPIAIAATAGTVGTGAIDPLRQLVTIARDGDLWLHVDGAYGAFAAIVPDAPAELAALADADSIACDPHKWLFAPIDAGVTLVRKPGLLQDAFAFHPAYLDTGASTHVDLMERTPENSRRLRALKVWLSIQAYGLSGYRDMIAQNIALAAHMERCIESTPGLTLAAPRELSIVCWRAEPAGMTDAALLDRLQTSIIAELEARGIAVISNAKLRDGRTAMRACIVNFRTTREDVEAVIAATADLANELGVRQNSR